MKSVKLSKGLFALVDDEDFEKVSAFKWSASTHKTPYAIRSFGPKNHRQFEYMHRFIVGADPNLDVDHENGNTLDNRKENLRIASRSDNMKNRNHSVIAKSGFRGVYAKKGAGKPWYARIVKYGKVKHLGYFYTAEEAAKAFDKAAKEIYGEFCGRLNFE
jgi:hypothetical protein